MRMQPVVFKESSLYWLILFWLGMAMFSICTVALAETAIAPKQTRSRSFSVVPPEIVADSGDGAFRRKEIQPGEIRLGEILAAMTLAQQAPAAPAAAPESVPGHKESATAAIFSPDGRLVASGDDGAVYVWEVATGRALHHFQTEISHVHFSPDGRFLAVAGRRNLLDVYDLQTDRPAFYLTGDQAVDPLLDPAAAELSLRDFAFSPDGKVLAAIVYCRRLKPFKQILLPVLWDVASRKLIHSLPEVRTALTPRDPAVYVKFSPDGKLLAIGSPIVSVERVDFGLGTVEGATFLDATSRVKRGVIRLWDTAAWNEVRALSFPKKPWWLGEFSFSPDGKILAAACEKSVLLWDVSSGQLARTLTGLVEFANGIAFSPDGRWLVATELAQDKAVAWDLVSGQQSASFGFPGQQKEREFRQFGFSPDGKLLAFPASTGDIHLVEPLTGKVVRTFGTARSLEVMGPFRLLREGALESYIEPPPSIPFFTKKNLPSNFSFYTCEVDLENLSEQAEYLTAPTELWGIGRELVGKPFMAGFKPAFPLLMVLPTGGAGASKFELTLGKPTSVRFSEYQLSGVPMTSVKVEPHSRATLQLVFMAPASHYCLYLNIKQPTIGDFVDLHR